MTELEHLALTTERLCCDYARRDARSLRAEVVRTLADIGAARARRRTLRDRYELLVHTGWLTCLLACLDYDLGDARLADRARRVARSIGHETGHGEIIAWTFELSAWFALTGGQLSAMPANAVLDLSRRPDGSEANPMRAAEAKLALAVLAVRAGTSTRSSWGPRASGSPR